jgi:hypothetical protein
MDEHQRLQVFQAQTENVRQLEKTWSHVNRQINALILARDNSGLLIHTKILALTYCALAEALFSKLIHTPHGFDLGYIDQIKIASDRGGIKNGWLKCAELAISAVQGSKTSHGQNVKKKLTRLIKLYIFDPSVMRNKLAHGQWVIALNKDNTAINKDVTKEIRDLTVVELYRRKSALAKLSIILEDIIESPNKAHHRDYWGHLVEYEEELKRMSAWTMEKKMEQLFAKKTHAQDRCATCLLRTKRGGTEIASGPG